jgi:hypothetical protein
VKQRRSPLRDLPDQQLDKHKGRGRHKHRNQEKGDDVDEVDLMRNKKAGIASKRVEYWLCKSQASHDQ